MPSNKKKRGKQRRAKQAERQSASVPANRGNEVNEINESFASVWGEDSTRYRRAYKSLPAEKIVADIKRGHYAATDMTTHLCRETDVQFLARLRGAGLVEVVLDLLKDCHNEFSFSCPSLMPSQWMVVLCSVNVPEYHMKIVESLDPVVQLLSNDCERRFFHENKYWHFTFHPYLQVIWRIVGCSKEEGNPIIPMLIKYDGFLQSVIHSMFWKSHRPDIVGEVESLSFWALGDALSSIFEMSLKIIYDVMDYFIIIGDSEGIIETIATTLVVSKAYDPECGVSFVEGLIRVIPQLPRKEYNEIAFYLLRTFVGKGCVDRGVITAAIDYGKDIAASQNDAVNITGVFVLILLQSKELEFAHEKEVVKEVSIMPYEGRYIAAIGAGLLQMCLHLLSTFGSEKDEVLSKNVEHILWGASKLAYLKKTSHALSMQGSSIREAWDVFKTTHSATENERIMALMNPIVLSSGKSSSSSYDSRERNRCDCCDKYLAEEDVKQCAACKMKVYCSRECQLKSWENGHKTQCKNFIKNRRRLKSMDNRAILLTGLDIVMQNLDNIILQASMQHLDCVHDCVVTVDFVAGPPLILVQPTADFHAQFLLPGGGGEFVGAKECIEAARADGSLSCCFATFGKLPQKNWLMHDIPLNAKTKSWKICQEFLEETKEYAAIIEKCKDPEYKAKKLHELHNGRVELLEDDLAS